MSVELAVVKTRSSSGLQKGQCVASPGFPIPGPSIEHRIEESQVAQEGRQGAFGQWGYISLALAL